MLKNLARALGLIKAECGKETEHDLPSHSEGVSEAFPSENAKFDRFIQYSQRM